MDPVDHLCGEELEEDAGQHDLALDEGDSEEILDEAWLLGLGLFARLDTHHRTIRVAHFEGGSHQHVGHEGSVSVEWGQPAAELLRDTWTTQQHGRDTLHEWQGRQR